MQRLTVNFGQLRLSVDSADGEAPAGEEAPEDGAGQQGAASAGEVAKAAPAAPQEAARSRRA